MAAVVDCEALRKRIYEYLDGAIAGIDCEKIEQHLRICKDCFSLAELEALHKKMIRAKCCEEAPPSLIQRIRDLLSGS